MKKNLITSAILACGLSLSAAQAHAALSGITYLIFPPLGAVLCVIAQGPLLIGGIGHTFSSPFSHDEQVSLQVGLLGLLILEEPSSTFAHFKPLGSAQAHELGVTELERTAYNSSIDEIASINQSVTREALSKVGLDRVRAHQLWEKYQAQLDPAAFSALKKVSKRLARSMTQFGYLR